VASALAVLEAPAFCSLATQAQWLGLYYSVSRRVNHLARFLSPAQLEAADALAREKLSAYACSFLRIATPMSPTVQRLLELPLRLGGLGLRLFTREPAFLAGMLAARAVLRTRFDRPLALAPSLPPEDQRRRSFVVLKEAVEHAFLPSRALGRALAEARTTLAAMETEIVADVANRPQLTTTIRGNPVWERLLDLDPDNPPPILAALVPISLADDPRENLQEHLSVFLHEAARLAFTRGATLEDDICRVSQSGPSAAAWLLAFPGGPSALAYRRVLYWPGSTFLTALQFRLGVPLSVLIAAGVAPEGTPCWLSRAVEPVGAVDAPNVAAAAAAAAAADDADAADAHAAAGAAAAAAAATDDADDDNADLAALHEEGARVDLPPTPHNVHQAGASAGPAAGSPIASTPPHWRLRRAAPVVAGRRFPHDLAKCGRHARRSITPCGRLLPCCPNGAGPILLHDDVAFAVAHLAPSGPSNEYPGAVRHATAVRPAIALLQQSLAPGFAWAVTDVAAYGDIFVDVVITHPDAPSRVERAAARCDGRSCVLNALSVAEAMKVKHYARELALGGPFAPGKGKLIPFAATDRGLLGPAARELLKRFAYTRCSVAGGGDGDARSPESQAFHGNGLRLISTVVQRRTACSFHAAATELCELSVLDPGLWPGAVDAPHVLRSLVPGPGVRDLLSLPPLELADIDAVGLAPVASLFG
jgi:hypothetical protein